MLTPYPHAITHRFLLLALLLVVYLPVAQAVVPQLSFHNLVVTVSKDVGTAQVTAYLDSPASNIITVNFSTADITAKAGIDYAASSGSLTFAPGETSKRISIPVFNHSGFHPEKRFFVALSGASGAAILAGKAVVSIKADAVMAAGSGHTCALTGSSAVFCWGDNAFGQLGTGSFSSTNTPVRVNGLSNVVALATGATHTCALTETGTVFCWGEGGHGELGNGSNTYKVGTPVQVSGLSNVVAVTAGTGFTCALGGDGAVFCWGGNSSGVLGNGSTSSRNTPVAVSGLSNVVAVAAGGFHACALTSDDNVYCWGSGYYGQLGNGNRSGSNTPVPVGSLSSAISLAAGGNHACAAGASGTTYCWGSGSYGQLGSGSSIDSSTPVPVGGIGNALALAPGGNHICALTDSGTALCLGLNDIGQLGNGTRNNSNTPTPATGLSGVFALTAGNRHTCAATGNGMAYCWGFGWHGQLGNGSTNSSSIPIAVFDLNLGDTIPNAFSFAAQTGAPFDTLITAPAITVSGINVATPISIVNGSYAINGGAFTEAVGSVASGDTVSVRLRSANTASTERTATLTIGGVSADFSVSTHAASSPDPFAFDAVRNAARSTAVTSGAAILGGFSGTLSISVSGGTYSINGQAFTGAPGTVSSGSSVVLRQTSASQARKTTSAVLTVGGSTASFDVTTGGGGQPWLMLLLD